MKIDQNLIEYLEDLSNLTFSKTERNALKEDLEKILNAMSSLNELDTKNIREQSHPFNNVNVFREDEVKNSLKRELILKNASKKNDEMFIAPKTLD